MTTQYSLFIGSSCRRVESDREEVRGLTGREAFRGPSERRTSASGICSLPLRCREGPASVIEFSRNGVVKRGPRPNLPRDADAHRPRCRAMAARAGKTHRKRVYRMHKDNSIFVALARKGRAEMSGIRKPLRDGDSSTNSLFSRALSLKT